MTSVTWVGEHGPELLNLPPDAQVIPLSAPSSAQPPEDNP